MKEEAIDEITLRKYEKPYDTSEREIAKKVCLSLGLLQPGDSRDVIVDILLVLVKAKKERKKLSLKEIKEAVIEERKKANLEIRGIADSNIRRQLKKLKDLFFVEKTGNAYRISEFASLKHIFEEKIENFYVSSIIKRIKEYLEELEKVGS